MLVSLKMPVRFASIIAEHKSISKVASYPLVVDCEPPALFRINFNGLFILSAMLFSPVQNIFEGGELQEDVVVAKNTITTQHGALENRVQTHEVNYYNLDVVISVGYRVVC